MTTKTLKHTLNWDSGPSITSQSYSVTSTNLLLREDAVFVFHIFSLLKTLFKRSLSANLLSSCLLKEIVRYIENNVCKCCITWYLPSLLSFWLLSLFCLSLVSPCAWHGFSSLLYLGCPLTPVFIRRSGVILRISLLSWLRFLLCVSWSFCPCSHFFPCSLFLLASCFFVKDILVISFWRFENIFSPQ